jgi:hypothetical protein
MFLFPIMLILGSKIPTTAPPGSCASLLMVFPVAAGASELVTGCCTANVVDNAASAAVSVYAAAGHWIDARRDPRPRRQMPMGKETLAPASRLGLFSVGGAFISLDAGVAPLCCRKLATKGCRLLCAAADASSLPPHRLHDLLLRIVRP